MGCAKGCTGEEPSISLAPRHVSSCIRSLTLMSLCNSVCVCVRVCVPLNIPALIRSRRPRQSLRPSGRRQSVQRPSAGWPTEHAGWARCCTSVSMLWAPPTSPLPTTTAPASPMSGMQRSAMNGRWMCAALFLKVISASLLGSLSLCLPHSVEISGQHTAPRSAPADQGNVRMGTARTP